MAIQNPNIGPRSLEMELWQEHLTMPSIRVLDCPDYKTYTVPLKEAGKGRVLEQMWEEHRAQKTAGTKKTVAIGNLAMLQAKAAFANTTIKSQRAKINHHVKLGLMVAASDLDTKRNKLKALVLKEETDLKHEYVNQAQQFANELLEKKIKRAEEIIALQEKEKEEQTRLLREQQIRENSVAYRDHLSKEVKLEIAEIQKQQICEKIIQRERDQQFEKFWLDLEKKREDERKKYEEEKEIVRLSKLREQREILNKQIIGKKIMEIEMKKIKEAENDFIDQLKERCKKEEEKEKEYIIQQKIELKKIKLAELEDSRRQRIKKAAEEKAFDDYYCKKVAESIEQEIMNRRDMRAELKREADYFIQQVKEINLAKLEEEKQMEVLRKQEIAKKEAIIEKNQEIMREAKEKLHRETLETWKQQVIHKKQVLESEKQIEKLCDQWSGIMLDKNKELDKLFDDYQKGGEVKLVKDLNSQIDHLNILKDRKILENEDFMNQQQRNQQLQEMAWKNVSKTCASSQLHPFTRMLLKK